MAERENRSQRMFDLRCRLVAPIEKDKPISELARSIHVSGS